MPAPVWSSGSVGSLDGVATLIPCSTVSSSPVIEQVSYSVNLYCEQHLLFLYMWA